MSIQAINAQSLKPAVSFKAEPEVETAKAEVAETPEKENKNMGVKVAGGATALALLGFGIYKMVKGKGTKEVKEAATTVAEEVKQAVKKEPKTVAEWKAIKELKEVEKIVGDFDKMRKPEDLKAYAKKKQELTHMDWDAKPLKREEVINKAKAEAAEAAKKTAEEAPKAAETAKKA